MSDLCDLCDSKAVWFYMPSDMQTCDEHVPRGCDCNHRYVSVDAYHPPLKSPDEPYLEGVENVDWKWVDEEKTYWCSLDEKGREFPCCEWGYYENGLDDEDPYDSY